MNSSQLCTEVNPHNVKLLSVPLENST